MFKEGTLYYTVNPHTSIKLEKVEVSNITNIRSSLFSFYDTVYEASNDRYVPDGKMNIKHFDAKSTKVA